MMPEAIHINARREEEHSRIRKQKWEGALLDLGRLREPHVVNTLEKILVPVCKPSMRYDAWIA